MPHTDELAFARDSSVMSSRCWSRRWDSNPRPTVYETVALPLSYFGPVREGGFYHRPSQASLVPNRPGREVADCLDVGDEDVAATVTRIALEGDEAGWLQNLPSHGGGLRAASDFEQRRQVVDLEVGLERVEPVEKRRDVDIGLR
jgi:hypothetical protein